MEKISKMLLALSWAIKVNQGNYFYFRTLSVIFEY